MPGDVEIMDVAKSSRAMHRIGSPSKHSRHTHRQAPAEDVIEITDSEDEGGPSTVRRALLGGSSSVWEVEGPSVSNSQPRAPVLSVAGPSSSPVRRQAAPLPPPSQTPSRVLEQEASLDFLPPPEVDADPFSVYVAQVLEIIPDVDPDHVLSLIINQHETYKDKVVEPVLHLLFEDPDYPKADKKGKRKREEEPVESVSVTRRRLVEVEVDYASEVRARPSGTFYQELSIVSLSFPQVLHDVD